MLPVFIGLLLVAATGYSNSPKSLVFKCKSDGLFPHLENCNLFYQCHGGVAYLQKCPADLHFNAGWEKCDHPKQAGCPIPDCFYVDDGYFPNPTDCSLYYQCSNGAAKLRSCNAGLHWDDKIKSCNWPHQAGCNSAASPVAYAANNVVSGSSKAKAPKCDKDGLIPDPSSCGRFYQCSNGIAHHFRCPAKLHFDTVAKVCGNPTSASCRAPDCSGTQALFPNPDDCTTFYECLNGSPVLQNCPTGFFWSADDSICTFEWEAVCATAKKL